MKDIILGTSGHIDHGKTSLIKALTGVDTDRLKEEKERGITIELGFASLTLPNGRRLGVIDVPGHEKFIKNMVAGATGIDLVAMIIAADEGIMPQTEEHMEICSLLGIKHGIVALTKIDMVDKEWLDLVVGEISEFTKGTFLENAPIVPVSSATGEGIKEFATALEGIAKKIPERAYLNKFRLPIDRVFTMKGFGTVITGTVIAGKVKTGDSISIYPPNIISKVRGIQVHNESVSEAGAGTRCAINFQGLEKSLLSRGYVVSEKDFLKPSYMTDVKLNYLKSAKKPLKSNIKVRFHTGTIETMANLVLLDKEKLDPGDSCLAQIRFYTPIATIKQDSFVIRSYSPVKTIGGGIILNPIAKKLKLEAKDKISALKEAFEKDAADILLFHLKEAGHVGLAMSDMIIMTNISEKKLDSVLAKYLSSRTVILLDKENRIYLHKEALEALIEGARKRLEVFHKDNPLKEGILKEELKSKILYDIKPKLFNLILNSMIKNKIIALNKDIVRLAEHKISLLADQKKIKENILKDYEKNGLTPAYAKDLIERFKINAKDSKELFAMLVKDKLLIKAKENLYFNANSVNILKENLIKFLQDNNEITAAQFKEIAKVPRKYLIPLLEYFDSSGVTIRVGDKRVLRGG
ncbi:MAG: selenocysteine-specific translation elongation factor [Deltaproteobacteria bacterium]|nr:selenocysteine-specific translation elongation factor [Deltaproteobacteria bacterium]